MCIKCHARKSILIFSYFGLFCICLQTLNGLFWFSHQIYRNLGRSISTQNKQIEFHSLPFNSIHDSVLYSPCVTVNFMRPEKKATIEFSMHKHIFDPNNVYTLHLFIHWSANWIWMMRFSYGSQMITMGSVLLTVHLPK